MDKNTIRSFLINTLCIFIFWLTKWLFGFETAMIAAAGIIVGNQLFDLMYFRDK